MVRTFSVPSGRARQTAGSSSSTRYWLMRALAEYVRSRTAAGSRRATVPPRGVSRSYDRSSQGLHFPPAVLTDSRFGQDPLRAIRTLPLLAAGREGAATRVLNRRGLLLDPFPELERAGDILEPLVRAAGPRDHDRPKTQDLAAHALLDADAFDFRQENLQRATVQPPDLDEDALVGDGELRAADGDVGDDRRDPGQRQEEGSHDRHARDDRDERDPSQPHRAAVCGPVELGPIHHRLTGHQAVFDVAHIPLAVVALNPTSGKYGARRASLL